MLLSCVVLSYVYDFIFGQGLFRACVVYLILCRIKMDFSYLMLVPVLSIQYTFLAAASFITAVLYVVESVCGSWTGVQRGTCHVGSCSDLYTVLLFCLYFLAILVCNFIIGQKLCRAYVILFYYVPNQNKVFLCLMSCV